MRFKDDQHLFVSSLPHSWRMSLAPVLQVKRMFKKHPGRKVTESAESQSNSAQTAGKTDGAQGEFARLSVCHVVHVADEIVPKSLIIKFSEYFFSFIVLIHHLHSSGYFDIESLVSESESNSSRAELLRVLLKGSTAAPVIGTRNL